LCAYILTENTAKHQLEKKISKTGLHVCRVGVRGGHCVSVVIGQSNNFGFGFTAFNRKPLQRHLIEIGCGNYYRKVDGSPLENCKRPFGNVLFHQSQGKSKKKSTGPVRQ